MARNTSIVLSDQLAEFIDAQVSQRRYGSASEALRAGLRLLEGEVLRRESVRDALIAGEESGPPEEFDLSDYVARRRSGE